MKKDFIHMSESVTDGHPDKLCDQISDAIVDRFLEQDVRARIIAECAVSSSVVFMAARFASDTKVDFPNVARKVIQRIGYMDQEFNFKSCSILTSLKEMVSDQPFLPDDEEISEDDIERIAALDQVTLFGFACKQSPTLLPLPIWLAHSLSKRLAQVRLENLLPYLAPDGTVQVGIEYRNRVPHRIHSITINSSQKDRTYPKPERLRDDLREAVIRAVFEKEPLKPDNETRVLTNPGGPLKLGGPSVHSGLTGRKNAIDTYGGYSRNSGSALSGKDPLRIDRVGAYAARYAAKNVVAAGLADQCEVQLSYSIGLPGPVSVQVETMGTGKISDEEISARVREHFDFRLGGIIKQFALRKLPSISKGGFYRKLAAYGHFGRSDMDLPWEKIDKTDFLSP
ncbi:MAG: methionine adenosyltransferase [Desulfomonile tiedjei]|nr:methionine adenosyltransferase [Desulfomonile tiedjei]